MAVYKGDLQSHSSLDSANAQYGDASQYVGPKGAMFGAPSTSNGFILPMIIAGVVLVMLKGGK